MPTKTVTESTKGIRYNAAQKQEVVDFVLAYNAKNGRGGQTKSSEHFKISPITVGTWLKAAGAKVSKSNTPKARNAKGDPATKQGTRYSTEQRQEVIDFVISHNASNGGRGGPSHAAKKFGISVITIGSWLKGSGFEEMNKTFRAAKIAAKAKKLSGVISRVSNDFDAKLIALQALSKQIAATEATLTVLNDKFVALKATL